MGKDVRRKVAKKVKTYGDSTKLKYSYSNHSSLNEITKLNKNRVFTENDSSHVQL